MFRICLSVVLALQLLGKTVEGGWRDEGLRIHNVYRAMHGAEPLVLDDKLNTEAQAWADKLAKQGNSEHASGIDQGENLFENSKWPADFEAKTKVVRKATKDWYSEIKDYDFLTAECHAVYPNSCGHFTQVVWKNSKKLGLGIAQKETADGWAQNYVVARYDPRGNFHMIGQKVEDYVANVSPKN